MAIDMWSLGCILAELYTGYALLPGEDEADQLACIIELLGMPPKKLLDQSKRAQNFISAKGYPRYCSVKMSDGSVVLGSGLSRRGKVRRPPGFKALKTALKGCEDPLFLSFLRGCLEWDPELRMTPAVALKHTWFRRRLPRPPQTPATNAIAGSSSSSSTSSAVASTVVIVEENGKAGNNCCLVPPVVAAASTTKNSISTPNTSRSSNNAIQSLSSISSGGSSTGAIGTNTDTSATAVAAAAAAAAAAATTNKLRVQIESSYDESMLSLNRSTISIHSAHRHNHHHHQHLSASGAPKLPQIQQGNTVT